MGLARKSPIWLGDAHVARGKRGTLSEAVMTWECVMKDGDGKAEPRRLMAPNNSNSAGKPRVLG